MTQVTLNNGSVDSAGSLVLKTNGTTAAVTIDTSQNVGIGTSSPVEKLAVTNTALTSTTVGANTVAAFRSNATGADTNIKLSDGVTYSALIGQINGNIYFSPNGTRAATIDTSGNLLVGTTSQQAKLTITNGANTNRALYVEGYPSGLPTSLFYRDNTDAQYVMQVRHDNAVSSSTGYMIQFVNQGGTGVGSITSTGSATSYTTSSDYRLKENIAPMAGALSVVQQLKPVTYSWKVDGSSGQGFIAHELQAVVPECVTGEKDATRIEQYEITPYVPATFDDEGNELTPAVEAVMGEREVPSYQGIDTSFLVAALTAAIQEQQALINAQQAALTTLTERITALEAK